MNDRRDAWEICDFISGECVSRYSPCRASNYFGMRSNARSVFHRGIRTIVLGVTSGLNGRLQGPNSLREGDHKPKAIKMEPKGMVNWEVSQCRVQLATGGSW